MAGLRKPGESERPTPRPRPAPPEQADEAPAHEDTTQADPTQADTTQADTTQADAGSEDAAPKPGPRRKQRSESSDKPAGEAELVGAAAPGTPPARLAAARAGKRGGRLSKLSRKGTYLLAAGLLVLAGLFTTGAVFAKLDTAAATNNAALVDVQKTQQVKKAMKSAAEQLFSFDYRDIAKTEQAAKKLLANKQVQQKYSMLMDEVRRLAPKQKIVVTVTATEAAVVELHEDSAKVMVYVDQTSTRTESKQSSAGGAALWFKTELRDGEWKVVGMDTYNSGDPMQPKQGGEKQGGQQPEPSGN